MNAQANVVRQRASLEDQQEQLTIALNKKKKAESSKTHSSGVVKKFIVFSVSLFICPVLIYCGTKRFLFDGINLGSNCTDNSILAGISAIVSVNAILILYVAFAAYEEYIENK